MAGTIDAVKMVAAVLFSCASVIAALWGTYVNWDCARKARDPNRRIQWVVEARREIRAHALISADDVVGRLRWLSDDETSPDKEWVTRLKRSDEGVGRYAVRTLGANKVLTTEDITQFPPSAAKENEAIVPVEVASLHAAALEPGQRVIFVKEKEDGNDGQIQPQDAIDGCGPGNSAFDLVGILELDDGEGKTTSLLVRLEQDQWSSIGALAATKWRPVVVGPRPRSCMRRDQGTRPRARRGSRGGRPGTGSPSDP